MDSRATNFNAEKTLTNLQ